MNNLIQNTLKNTNKQYSLILDETLFNEFKGDTKIITIPNKEYSKTLYLNMGNIRGNLKINKGVINRKHIKKYWLLDSIKGLFKRGSYSLMYKDGNIVFKFWNGLNDTSEITLKGCYK